MIDNSLLGGVVVLGMSLAAGHTAQADELEAAVSPDTAVTAPAATNTTDSGSTSTTTSPETSSEETTTPAENDTDTTTPETTDAVVSNPESTEGTSTDTTVGEGADTDSETPTSTTTPEESQTTPTGTATGNPAETSTGTPTETPTENPTEGATQSTYQPTNQNGDYWDPATPPVNADQLIDTKVIDAWDQGYRGQGMVIAIIDSGASPSKDFQLTDSSTAKISEDEVNQFIADKGYGTYVNEKIPFAYDYGSSDSDFTQTTIPLDKDHGQHTAGVAAANGTAADGDNYAIGVAPEAQILNMKVYDTYGSEVPLEVAQAIYDAVELGADVINMSLGIGITDEDDLAVEQEAVKYATDHGVIVTAAACNSGKSDTNDAFGNTVYSTKNTGTIGDPGVAETAITVAGSGGTTTGTKSADALHLYRNGSWGPTPTLDLKPDVAAPGEMVYSTGSQGGTTGKNGTSEAAPFIAGTAVLVKQYLMATTDLKGTELSDAIKLIIMNSARPIEVTSSVYNVDKITSYVSPRGEGSGYIDVAAATSLGVTAEDLDKGTGSVSLHQIGDTATFEVKFHNYSDHDVTYTFDANYGPMTQGPGGTSQPDKPISGASLTPAESTFTLKAGEEQTKSFTLSVPEDFETGQYVEGYLIFHSADGNDDLTVPYMGYYGDITEEDVFDVSDAGLQNYVADEKTKLPLGFGSLLDTVNGNKNTTTTGMDPEKTGFSPNGDGQADQALPVIFSKQNLKTFKGEILDSTGKVIKVIDLENRLEKTIKNAPLFGSVYFSDLSLSQAMRLHEEAFAWDGTAYDQTTGKEITVPDGEYTYRVTGTLEVDGKNTTQTVDLKLIVDTKVPEINNVTFTDGTLSFDYNDSGVGFTSNTQVYLGSSQQAVALQNDGTTNQGHFSIDLTADQLAQLVTTSGKLSISLYDAASNLKTTSITLPISGTASDTQEAETTDVQIPVQDLGGHGVSYSVVRADGNPDYLTLDNVIDNSFNLINNSNTAYDAATETFTIKGKVSDQTAALTIMGNSSYEASPENQVAIAADGSFTYSFKLSAPDTKPLGYKITTKDGEEIHGRIELVVDAKQPVIEVAQIDSLTPNENGIYDINTNSNTLDLSGFISDDTEGVTFYLNGSMLYRGKTGGQEGDAVRGDLSGPYELNQAIDLLEGDNYITLKAVDQTGNVTTKILHVVYTPGEAVTPTQTSNGANTKVATGAVSASTESTATQTAAALQPATAAAASTENLPKMGETKTSFMTVIGATLLAGLAALGIVSRKKESE